MPSRITDRSLITAIFTMYCAEVAADRLSIEGFAVEVGGSTLLRFRDGASARFNCNVFWSSAQYGVVSQAAYTRQLPYEMIVLGSGDTVPTLSGAAPHPYLGGGASFAGSPTDPWASLHRQVYALASRHLGGASAAPMPSTVAPVASLPPLTEAFVPNQEEDAQIRVAMVSMLVDPTTQIVRGADRDRGYSISNSDASNRFVCGAAAYAMLCNLRDAMAEAVEIDEARQDLLQQQRPAKRRRKMIV